MDTNTQPQTEPAQITVQDLASLHNVIDLAVQRGAFRGNEMTAVGTLFDKLAAFLKYAQDQVAQQTASDQPTEQATEGTE